MIINLRATFVLKLFILIWYRDHAVRCNVWTKRGLRQEGQFWLFCYKGLIYTKLKRTVIELDLMFRGLMFTYFDLGLKKAIEGYTLINVTWYNWNVSIAQRTLTLEVKFTMGYKFILHFLVGTLHVAIHIYYKYCYNHSYLIYTYYTWCMYICLANCLFIYSVIAW